MLPQHIINRIAAGEVLERPASAVKELVENALDAGARNLEIKLEAGGKNLISITDDGKGMNVDELQLAVQRHATSKLLDDDLLNINFFGFRGEALPAIGSVAKLKITSKQNECFAVEVIGGQHIEPAPSQLHQRGTCVEVRDLFFATPARLKFLKTENSEKQYALDIIRKIAIANPGVGFKVHVDGKIVLNFPASELLPRIGKIVGEDFAANSTEVQFERDGIVISGYAGIPTYNRRTSEDQYVYVNGRPVKDKVLQGALKAAYADFLGGGRFAVLVLFINIPSEEVDVNVHPAKSEVRFRDQRNVTGAVITALRDAIGQAGHKASTTVAEFAMNRLAASGSSSTYKQSYYSPYQPPKTDYMPLEDKQRVAEFRPLTSIPLPKVQPRENTVAEHKEAYPLGHAKCQLHGTYIISETANSIVITDQHAAHERLVYETYKKQIEGGRIAKQPLLVPEIVQLDEKRLENILSIQPKFQELGFELERFGNDIAVTQVPSILGKHSISNLLNDIADDIIEHGTGLSLLEAFEHVLETAACHNSIRAGRKLSLEEMNELLRQMENTPFSGQCNHGRPTYVELKLSDVETLFGRS